MSKSFDEVMQFTRNVSSHTAFEDEECKALYDYCLKVPRGGTVAEIGCQLGRTSSIIAQLSGDVGYRSIHIDPYTYQIDLVQQWIVMMHKIGEPFTFMCMRSGQADLDAAETDLLLIDGDHTLGAVRTDCGLAMEIIKPGGYMLAHDYGRESLPDVYQAVNEFMQHAPFKPIGVYGTLGVWQRL